MLSQADNHHKDLQSALRVLISAGGKRIRPTITMLIGNMLNAPKDRLLTLAAAIELLHTATLVHDDLIDGSLLRRGMPTLNSRWSPGATVLTGDFLFARAAKLAAETESIPVMKIFSRTLTTIVNGEINQLLGSHCLANRDDYFQRIYAKTASLFETSAWAAALISQTDDTVIENMKQYGLEIGTAFQIIDDILDFTGEQVTVGKPVGSDLRQGLITLPTLYYFEENPSHPDVHAILEGNCPQDEETLQRLIECIRQSNAIEKAYSDAKQFVQRGLERMRQLAVSSERLALEDLANYIIQRRI
ncbi:MAG: polyprenyl synthetase family protein [Chloroflexi bacterium]|nr:polyprenyl synthetase family protein [Anaerolineaceae bacterium]NMB87148.1 polyprenyl synthetase family protein [Chloroflexota bacterium]